MRPLTSQLQGKQIFRIQLDVGWVHGLSQNVTSDLTEETDQKSFLLVLIFNYSELYRKNGLADKVGFW